jgi:uncharacterized membrane protein (Fun14 family)
MAYVVIGVYILPGVGAGAEVGISSIDWDQLSKLFFLTRGWKQSLVSDTLF